MSDSISKIIHELNNKNFEKALKLCEKFQENNDLHILNNLKGIIFINLKDHLKAIEYFKKSLNYKKDYLEGYSNLANAYFSIKNFSKSINTILEALNYDAKNKDLHFNLAFFFSENNQYQKAVEYYYEAMKFGYNKEK